MILKKPLIFASIYFLGYFIEYLTPACAAKLKTKSNFSFLKIFSNNKLFNISSFLNLKFLN